MKLLTFLFLINLVVTMHMWLKREAAENIRAESLDAAQTTMASPEYSELATG